MSSVVEFLKTSHICVVLTYARSSVAVVLRFVLSLCETKEKLGWTLWASPPPLFSASDSPKGESQARCVDYRVLVLHVAVRFISRDPFLRDGAQLLPIKLCVQFFLPSFFPSPPPPPPPFFVCFLLLSLFPLLSFSFFHTLRTHWSVAHVRFSACHLGPHDGTYSDFCHISQKCYQYKPVFVNKRNLFPDKLLRCCVFEPLHTSLSLIYIYTHTHTLLWSHSTHMHTNTALAAITQQKNWD